MSRLNLFDHWSEEGHADAGEPIQLVRPEANEVAVVPFTSEMTPVRLHFPNLPEIQGYVLCNGDRCVLCRAGRKVEERVLLPVYLPASRGIGVLPISPASRPGALRPPVMAALRSGKKLGLLISKPDRMTFRVTTIDLQKNMDDGARVIKAFLAHWDAGEVNLASVYPRIDDRDLAEMPSIAAMLQFKKAGTEDAAVDQAEEAR